MKPRQLDRGWLFGPTSIIGWQLYQLRPELRAFCNPYVRSKQPWEPLLLEDRAAISAILQRETPDYILHCGGVCDVARCEADPDWTWQVNVDSVAGLLAELPPSVRLVYVSSDHVYGHSDQPCDEHSPRRPISVYGRGRVAAEDLVLARPNSLVIRPGLPIGPSFDRRSGHLDWLQYRHARQLPITIVHDEVRSAVWSIDLGQRILALADSAICGVRNIAAPPVDRETLARFLCKRLDIDPPLQVASRAEQAAPHLGRVELASAYDAPLSTVLSVGGAVPAATGD